MESAMPSSVISSTELHKDGLDRRKILHDVKGEFSCPTDIWDSLAPATILRARMPCGWRRRPVEHMPVIGAV